MIGARNQRNVPASTTTTAKTAHGQRRAGPIPVCGRRAGDGVEPGGDLGELGHRESQQLGGAVGVRVLLHVGDDPHTDIAGAANAGLRSCWIDRGDHAWPAAMPAAELHMTTLTELADWLERNCAPHATRKEQAA